MRIFLISLICLIAFSNSAQSQNSQEINVKFLTEKSSTAYPIQLARKRCRLDQNYNEILRTCLPKNFRIPGNIECKYGTVWDKSRNKCTCPKKQTWNAQQRRCESKRITPVCDSGFTYNRSKKRCVSNIPICPPYYSWGTSEEKCIYRGRRVGASTGCPSGLTPDPVSNLCVAICSEGYKVSKKMKRCVKIKEKLLPPPPPVCPRNFIWDAKAKVCIDKASIKERELIRKEQQCLNTLNYDAGTPDGLIGNKTREAIAKFHFDNGFRPRTELSNEARKRLFERCERKLRSPISPRPRPTPQKCLKFDQWQQFIIRNQKPPLPLCKPRRKKACIKVPSLRSFDMNQFFNNVRAEKKYCNCIPKSYFGSNLMFLRKDFMENRYGVNFCRR